MAANPHGFNYRNRLFVATSLAAVALPTWVTAAPLPVLSFASQVTALIGWGLLTVAIGCFGSVAANDDRLAVTIRRPRTLVEILAVVAIFALLIAASAAAVWRGAPGTLALARIGVLAAALLVLCCGWRVMRAGEAGAMVGEAFLWSLLFAGVVNAGIGFIQVAAPDWPDEFLLARLRVDLRPAGNLRQPNFLATQLVWSIAAAAALREMRRLHAATFLLVAVTLTLTIVMTASRTGLVTACMLVVWGALDRRLSRITRWMLMLVPLLLLLDRLALDAWQAGEQTLVLPTGFESSRYHMWLDTLKLIAAEPLWGVGLGEFNFAWTLTPSERMTTETFTHTHNLLLQWAVELGLPLTLAMTALLCIALRQAFVTARNATGDAGILRRCALVLVAVMLLHSQTEFPLWYAYFLLPSAFVLGMLVAPATVDNASRIEPPTGASTLRSRLRSAVASPALTIGGLLLGAGGVAALLDYRPVAAIFQTLDSAEQSRLIDEGRRSTLFGHHADRFAATLQPRGSRRLEPYQRVLHEMLDLRLMIAWSQALHENGDVERARFVAARVREFNHPAAAAFFAICSAAPGSATPIPFQCTPLRTPLTFRDFR